MAFARLKGKAKGKIVIRERSKRGRKCDGEK